MRQNPADLRRIISLVRYVAKFAFDGYLIVLLAVVGLAMVIRSMAGGDAFTMNSPSSGALAQVTSTATSSATPSSTIFPTVTITPTMTATATSIWPTMTSTPWQTPTPSRTPSPTHTPPPPPTATPTPTPPFTTDTVYISADSDGAVDGIVFSDEDILAFEGTSGDWSLYFDGSDVVPVDADVDAFAFLADDSILLSFDAIVDLPDIPAAVDPYDIVRFVPTSLGDETAGTFQVLFDGSDVALDTLAEDIDAVAPLPGGRLLISTVDDFDVGGLIGSDDDILLFTPTSLGDDTSGNWQLGFDGADVGLTDPGEDVEGVWVPAATPEIYLNSEGPFAVDGVSGNDEDIFSCSMVSGGSNTSCIFGPGPYWDGSAADFGAYNVDGFTIGP